MDDNELLKRAAKAVGRMLKADGTMIDLGNPLEQDDAALILACMLDIDIYFSQGIVVAYGEGGDERTYEFPLFDIESCRRAIVRAAADMAQ